MTHSSSNQMNILRGKSGSILLALATSVSPLQMVQAAAPIEQGDWAAVALGPHLPTPIAEGPISTGDLLRLRDLGGLSLSPDGQKLAFSIRQGDPKVNDYAVRWLIIRTDGSSTPITVEVDGGRPITGLGGLGLRAGALSILPEPAKWSPDGRHIAFRRQIGERIELWTAATSNGAARKIYGGAPQVDAFSWSTSGALVFRTGLNAEKFASETAAEAEHGWLADSRMPPFWAARTPSPLAPDCKATAPNLACEIRTWTADAKGRLQPATRDELATLREQLTPVARGALRSTLPTNGAKSALAAWADVADPVEAQSFRPLRRIITDAQGVRPCVTLDCTGVEFRELGWARGGSSVWFLKRVSSRGDDLLGPFDQTALYEWRLDSGEVRTIARGESLIGDCQAYRSTVFCKQSSSTYPERIVAIDLDSASVTPLVDPNPAMARKQIPRIRTITLKDPDGNFGFAHLVYPNKYEAGTRYPLVVVPYRSSGFLRGGTPGDDYPIFPLAAAGLFVLSVDIPNDMKTWRRLPALEIMRKERIEQRGLRTQLAAIENAISPLIADGLVDRHRIAITGLSWGAQLVHYALQHTDMFATAIASQGSIDQSYFAQWPEGSARDFAMAGMSTTTILPAQDSQILQTAWSSRPEKLRVPLLLNLGQDEALMGFEGIAVLKRAGRPLEVRIFPEEGHTKYHPRSFSGVYDNNMMWLKYWLLDEEDARPQFRAQYERWKKMRAL